MALKFTFSDPEFTQCVHAAAGKLLTLVMSFVAALIRLFTVAAPVSGVNSVRVM